MKIYSRSIMIVQTVLINMEINKTIDYLTENIIVNTSTDKEHFTKVEITI